MHKLLPSAKAIIFDVDGTLYDPRKLRLCMMCKMTLELMKHTFSINELKILWHFRKAREKNASHIGQNIEKLQFKWAADKLKASNKKVECVVQEWIFKKPLRYMAFCRYPGVLELFSELKKRNIRIGVFSDYPSIHKLTALGLEADAVVSATDPDVDRLKPDPKGLFAVASKLKVSIKDCILIGDRDDRDGECARRAGISYLILNRRGNHASHEFRCFFEIFQQFQICSHQPHNSNVCSPCKTKSVYKK